MLERYPRKVSLKHDRETILRPMSSEDAELLYDFFSRVPEEDRLYLKDDVTNQQVIDRWVANLRYDRILPILALVDDIVVGDATLHQSKRGWKRHIGLIRLVVAEDLQNYGLGKVLIQELCELAAGYGLEQVMAEVPNDLHRAVGAFERSGFTKAVVLEGFIKDKHGDNTDIALMIKKVLPG